MLVSSNGLLIRNEIPLFTAACGTIMRPEIIDPTSVSANCERSVKIGREGYFDVTNAIGRGARAANDRFFVNAAYLQHIS